MIYHYFIQYNCIIGLIILHFLQKHIKILNMKDNEHIFYHHTYTLTPKKEDFYGHIHNEYELLFFYGGKADFDIGGKSYHLRKNDLILVKPAIYHYLNILSDSTPYDRVVFNFRDDDIDERLRGTLTNLGIRYSINPESPIKYLIDALIKNENILSKEEFEYNKESTINNIIACLNHLQMDNDYLVKDMEDTFSLIVDYIDNNPEASINSKVLKDMFYVSESWISHAFKNRFGMSLMQYVNKKKILYAQQLIETGTSIKRASEICEYKDYTTFYRQYKKYLGKEPMKDKGRLQ